MQPQIRNALKFCYCTVSESDAFRYRTISRRDRITAPRLDFLLLIDCRLLDGPQTVKPIVGGRCFETASASCPD